MKQVKERNTTLFHDWLYNDFYTDELLQNEKLITQQAEENALRLFHDAATRVPAYKMFLEKYNINPQGIHTIQDFKRVPTTDKENYIDQYSVEERCWYGDISTMHIISTSSGTTGEPKFWPRDLQTEIEGARLHEFIFNHVLNLKQEKILFINGFAMGNWIAGTFTSACVNLINWKGYSITMMSPGYNEEAILEIIKNLAKEFDQIIITGHTPFIKELIEVAIRNNINWKELHIKILGTGQAITESWRQYLLHELGSDNYNHTIINLYGSADAALMGFESALSIDLRVAVSKDIQLNRKLFKSDRIPSLYNYDPRLTYFEEENNELLITKNSGAPLIKYNIHDQGGIISYSNLLHQANEFGIQDPIEIQTKTNNQLPFVYLFGRDKFMVKIYGANVYTEHVQAALNHEKLQKILTGRYILEQIYDKNNDPKLLFRIELNKGISENDELRDLVKEVFVDVVRSLNSEYNFVLNELQDKVKPQVILHSHGDETYFPKNVIKKTS